MNNKYTNYKKILSRSGDISEQDLLKIAHTLQYLKQKRLFDLNQQQHFISRLNQKIMNYINEDREYENLKKLMNVLIDIHLFDMEDLVMRKGDPYDNYILSCKEWYSEDEIALTHHVEYLSSLSRGRLSPTKFSQADFDGIINEIIDDISNHCGKFLKIVKL